MIPHHVPLLSTLIVAAVLHAFANPASAKQTSAWAKFYTIENIPIPKNTRGEIDGLSFLPDGRLAVLFFREGLWIFTPSTGDWARFAEGFHEPLGIHAESPSEMVVMQRPELTRVIDRNGDGQADEYRVVSDAFGMSGNYHEFAFGPVRDHTGNYFIGLNTASNGDGIFDEVRGTFRADGRPGRMYSCVPWRGWILRIAPDGTTYPFASGFRSPNGLGFDGVGRLFATDNQGDWLGTSPLYHVREGGFHGHPASLVWTPDWNRGVPSALPPGELDAKRHLPTIQFPHGILANSPTQPLLDSTNGKFGHTAGNMLIGEMNHPHLLRTMIEEVDGELQGAACSFLPGIGIPSGSSRLAFAPDGTLWVGFTRRDRGWTGSTGIKRITWNGEKPLDVSSIHMTDSGFRILFTHPVDPADDIFSGRRYYYRYHNAYGSPQQEVQPIQYSQQKWSDDRMSVHLSLNDPAPGFIYEINLPPLSAGSTRPILTKTLFYTANRWTDGRRAPPRIAQNSHTAKIPTAKTSPLLNLPDLAPNSLVLDASTARLQGGARIETKNAGYTGQGFVDFIGHDKESISWTLPDTLQGEVTLRFRYALFSKENRPLELIINGQVHSQLPFPSGNSWTQWLLQDASVRLPPSPVVVALRSFGHSGPNIDALIIPP